MQNEDKTMQNRHPLKNTGVIVQEPFGKDYVAGVNSQIEFEVLEKTGIWIDNKPTDEFQASKSNGDYNICTNEASDNLCEIQLEHQRELGLIPPGLLNLLKAEGYIDENNKFNFNDCYDAVMSRTDFNRGNTLQAVWQSKRDNGLLPEKDWKHTEDNLPKSEYGKPIPQHLIDKARKIFGRKEDGKFIEPQYEFIYSNPGGSCPLDLIEKHLKQAPLQIAAAVCPGWNNDPIILTCDQPIAHSTVIAGKTKEFLYDYDSYFPFLKKLALDYELPHVLKGFLRINTFELTCEMARYAWNKFQEIKDAFPALQVINGKEYRLYAKDNTAYTLYDWCREYGVYEHSEIFVYNQLDWGSVKKIELKSEDMPPIPLKKNEKWWEALISLIKSIFNKIINK
jgi:hypothetical protein